MEPFDDGMMANFFSSFFMSKKTPNVDRIFDDVIPLLYPHYPLVIFNIAMENGPFIDGLPIKNSDFPWLCWITRGYI